MYHKYDGNLDEIFGELKANPAKAKKAHHKPKNAKEFAEKYLAGYLFPMSQYTLLYLLTDFVHLITHLLTHSMTQTLPCLLIHLLTDNHSLIITH